MDALAFAADVVAPMSVEVAAGDEGTNLRMASAPPSANGSAESFDDELHKARRQPGLSVRAGQVVGMPVGDDRRHCRDAGDRQAAVILISRSVMAVPLAELSRADHRWRGRSRATL
jgi:hypothetical protein